MKRTLAIKDLPLDTQAGNEATLSHQQMQRITGGRAVSAVVDGRTPGTVDDWDINIAIFEGRISGPYIV
ncbi:MULTISPECIES: hypothetical protein [unclassified Caballeronia]|uniref:hypothetical protein n=1 Tax=unclassified Caballeronia TaxID=2646786 RepID=UPI0028609730|nr:MULTISPECIES: hypothetical protein [unclassified Caballeronia]MDR5738899.1 hypothetical protein [Caballeronia sp. LZ016]MDR5807387.1 hypothetical protein [Caballeronia sp. LZ019]